MSIVSGQNQGFKSTRVVADLEAAYVELLSAACAIGRVRNRHSFPEIAMHCEPALISNAIRTADAICEYIAALKTHIGSSN